MRCASAPEPVPRSTTAGAVRGDDVDRRGGGVDQLAVMRNQRGDQLVVFARLDAEMCGGAHVRSPAWRRAARCQCSMSAAVTRVAVMQRPVERGDQIVGVFEADGEANQPIEAVALQLIGRGEVFGHGAVVVDLGRQAVERQRVADDHGGGEHVGEMARAIFVGAGDPERQHRAVTRVVPVDRGRDRDDSAATDERPR